MRTLRRPGQLADHHAHLVADQLRLDVLVALGAPSRPPRRGCRPCARTRCGRRTARAGRGRCWRSRRRSATTSVSRAQLLGRDTLVAHLELQVGDERHQVDVAAALAVAVDRALHLHAAGPHRRQRVRDRQRRRRCACGCRAGSLEPICGQRMLAHDLLRQRTSSGSAPPLVSHSTMQSAPASAAAVKRLERVLGDRACSRRRSARRRRSPLAALLEVGHAVADHAQVLLARRSRAPLGRAASSSCRPA